MRILFLFFLLSCLGIGKAQEFNQQKLSLNPYVNWKKEDLRWTIAGTDQGTNPNILSELDWSGLIGPQIGLNVNIPILTNLFAEVEGNYHRITKGKVVDIDYAGDNRAYTTSQLLLRADKGTIVETKAKISYLLLQKKGFRLLPQIGYWGKYQTLYMLDGPEPLIPGRTLQSTYQPRWFGISTGLRVAYKLGNWDWGIDFSGVRITRYRAAANWNLQDEFQQPLSFAHTSNGGGLDIHLNIDYQILPSFLLSAHAEYVNFKAGKGVDELYYADDRVVRTQLNGVYAHAIAAGVGVKCLLK